MGGKVAAMPTIVALAHFKEKHCEAVRSLSAEQQAELEQHRSTLRRYEMDAVALGHLSDEIVALEDLIRDFQDELKRTRGSIVDPRVAHALISRVQRHVMNYLSLFRAFIDHTDRRLRVSLPLQAAALRAAQACAGRARRTQSTRGGSRVRSGYPIRTGILYRGTVVG